MRWTGRKSAKGWKNNGRTKKGGLQGRQKPLWTVLLATCQLNERVNKKTQRCNKGRDGLVLFFVFSQSMEQRGYYFFAIFFVLCSQEEGRLKIKETKKKILPTESTLIVGSQEE